MKHLLTSAIAAATLFGGIQAYADDTAKPDTMTMQQKQSWKDCQTRQHSMDSSMSKEAINSACTAEMKSKASEERTRSDSMSKSPSDSTSTTGTPPKQ